ncbi:RNA polymerase III subunit RPC82-domain-containing protein [Pestalotiopsis sp. NC0098]|nr:RNA polymerase III subunit RPC82-domain-containing protein [Pestalotiopsis sp. NC0098]
MAVTKNVAELSVLLIEESYGQLPARIFDVLLSKGRTTLKQLALNTSMNQRLVRHGLVVLIQQNLIFHHTLPDTDVTHYEANVEEAYNIVRIGKILDAVHRGYGQLAKELVHRVLVNGHIRMDSLTKHKSAGLANGETRMNGHANGATSESSTTEHENDDLSQQTFDTIAHLIAIGILEPLNLDLLQPPDDLRAEIESDVMREYPTGLRGTKQKNDYNAKCAQIFRERTEVSKDLRRSLERDYLSAPTKRRKLENGYSAIDRDSIIEPGTILHVNYHKCMVELRNHRLAHYAEDMIGPVTAQVYAATLAALGKKLQHCHLSAESSAGDIPQAPTVTTLDIYEYLRPSVDVFSGIGRCDPEAINIAHAEEIHASPPDEDGEQDMDSLAYGHDDTNGDVDMTNGHHINGHQESDTKVVTSQNGTRDTKVKFAERVPTKMERMQQMRQHLLILAESNMGFVRHCGTKDLGVWTVDFGHVIPKLQLFEIDALIEESFGRQGLRLVKVLRAKGKIDDKTLPTFALMKKSDVYLKMAEMELQGYLEVQEVPRDNNRTASRTLFLWFFDKERTMARVVNDTYKAMSRHLQRLEVERLKKKNVLSVVQRKDVQGMEEEKLRGDIYNEYQEFLDIESKLLGQISRLDDLVSLFRDF